MATDKHAWRQRWAGRSIVVRLMLAALLMVMLALPLAGWLLSHHYRSTALTAFDQRLEATLNVVIAGVTYDPLTQQVRVDRALGDARFEQVFSGWYWQVTDQASQTQASRSLWDQRLPVTDSQRMEARNLTGPRQQSLRVVERDIYLAPLEVPLHVSVAADDSALRQDVARFQRALWLGLLGLGGLLLGVLALQVRWGLSPLRRMTANLRDVEQGQAARMDTDLPEELANLAVAMNGVLARDERLIERGRHTAGNLAHALKTPLSVLRMQVKQLPVERQASVANELARLDSAVRHHLARASAAGEGAPLVAIDLTPTLEPLVAGLGRLAQRRQIALQQSAPETLRVHMDRQDIQEMVGNLLDNALRWATRRVDLELAGNAQTLMIKVVDDGPGMSAEECQAALARGKRLDEQRSESGLGLAIVNDLVTLYNGHMTLERAASGGLQVLITLPVMAR